MLPYLIGNSVMGLKLGIFEIWLAATSKAQTEIHCCMRFLKIFISAISVCLVFRFAAQIILATRILPELAVISNGGIWIITPSIC